MRVMAIEICHVCCHGNGETTSEICLCFKAYHRLGFASSGLEKQLLFRWPTVEIHCDTEAVTDLFNKYLTSPGHIRQDPLNLTARDNWYERNHVTVWLYSTDICIKIFTAWTSVESTVFKRFILQVTFTCIPPSLPVPQCLFQDVLIAASI